MKREQTAASGGGQDYEQTRICAASATGEVPPRDRPRGLQSLLSNNAARVGASDHADRGGYAQSNLAGARRGRTIIATGRPSRSTIAAGSPQAAAPAGDAPLPRAGVGNAPRAAGGARLGDGGRRLVWPDRKPSSIPAPAGAARCARALARRKPERAEHRRKATGGKLHHVDVEGQPQALREEGARGGGCGRRGRHRDRSHAPQGGAHAATRHGCGVHGPDGRPGGHHRHAARGRDGGGHDVGAAAAAVLPAEWPVRRADHRSASEDQVVPDHVAAGVEGAVRASPSQVLAALHHHHPRGQPGRFVLRIAAGAGPLHVCRARLQRGPWRGRRIRGGCADHQGSARSDRGRTRALLHAAARRAQRRRVGGMRGESLGAGGVGLAAWQRVARGGVGFRGRGLELR
eukprot:5858327-Prymnesium_polylepis.1